MLTDFARADIQRRYRAGESGQLLAAEYGVTRQSVYRIADFRRRGPMPNMGNSRGPVDSIREREERHAENQRQDAARAAKDRELATLFASARPTGERCQGGRACPFPAVLEGLCRQHYVDAHSQYSVSGSSLMPTIQQAHCLYLGE
jgi:hypothetical protein